ncbi:hypothetical protein [Exiguobacterium sp. s133]|uniref:hypothetical protein n=1 Tax=Exiguobacterium sp. s133 TaxID=2751213 RepID=UPI001BE66E5F|nr:hypothetical protein [Exiguobacterium sp. s133]
MLLAGIAAFVAISLILIFSIMLLYDLLFKVFPKMGTWSLYEVKQVDRTKGYDKITYTPVIIDEDSLVPVSCEESVGEKLFNLIELNKNDKKIFIKATINRESLSIQGVKGYLIK